MAELICIKNIDWSHVKSEYGHKIFFGHENMGVDTLIIWMWLILAKIFIKFKFPVMADLICIKTTYWNHVNSLKMVLKCSLSIKIWG